MSDKPIFNRRAADFEQRGHWLEITVSERLRETSKGYLFRDLSVLRVRDGRTGKLRSTQIIRDGDLERAAKALA
jgi:hypothetical protein